MREIQGFTHVMMSNDLHEEEAARQGSPPAVEAALKPERHSEKFARLAQRPKYYQASTPTSFGIWDDLLCSSASNLMCAKG